MKILPCPFQVVLFLAIVVAAGPGRAASLSLEAGASYVDVSGVRPYAARGHLTENETSARLAPLLRLSLRLDEAWSVGVGYTQDGSLQGAGVSPDSDIFNDSEFAFPAFTRVGSRERIHDTYLDVRYRFRIHERTSLELGPVVSWFSSRAHIFPVNFDGGRRGGRWFTDSELRLGGVGQLDYRVSERWSAGLSYRLAKPTSRTLQVASLSATYLLR